MSEPVIPAPALSVHAFPSALPWWVPFVVIACAFLLTAGAIVALVNPAMLVGPGENINGAVRVYAGYLVSRNLSVAVMLVGTLIIRARRALGFVLVLTALIQAMDAGIDCLEQRWALVPGVLIIGFLLLLSASRVSQSGFWKPDFWRDPHTVA